MRSRCYRPAILLSLLLFGACASEPVLIYRHELADQILKPREGYKGLTNRACTSYKDGKCSSYVVEDRLLEDAQFRETVNKLGFICNVGGRRFKVCQDKPGLCRIWFTDCGLFCRKKRHEEYVPASNYRFLLDAKTRCFAKDKYPFDGSWGDGYGNAQLWGDGS